MEYMSCNVLGKEYYFDAKILATDDLFLENFKKDSRMQKKYNHLKNIFSEYDGFIVYYKELLSDEFMESFQYGMNHRWNSETKIAYDPAVTSVFYGLTSESLATMQEVLVSVYRLFGKKGLKRCREFSLALGLTDVSSFVLTPENSDDFEPKETSNNYFNLQRTLDFLSCETLMTGCLNENIKSVLFALPELLYDENGRFIDSVSCMELLREIHRRIHWNIDLLINEEDFWQVAEICRQIYFEKEATKASKKSEAKLERKYILLFK